MDWVRFLHCQKLSLNLKYLGFYREPVTIVPGFLPNILGTFYGLEIERWKPINFSKLKKRL